MRAELPYNDPLRVSARNRGLDEHAKFEHEVNLMFSRAVVEEHAASVKVKYYLLGLSALIPVLLLALLMY